MIMPFGNYKGTPIKDLPLSYLAFLTRSNIRFSKGLRRVIEAALAAKTTGLERK